jgi:hypothetical protein
MPTDSYDESASKKILRLACERRVKIYRKYCPFAGIKRWCSFHKDVQKMINELEQYRKTDKQIVCEAMLTLDVAFEFASQRSIMDLTLVSLKKKATFLEQLKTLNNKYENFYARTFPLQWQNIISRLTWADKIKECLKIADTNNESPAATKK